MKADVPLQLQSVWKQWSAQSYDPHNKHTNQVYINQ